MANIKDYLHWRGDLKIENDDVNEIDVLVLSELAYFPFEKLSLTATSAPISILEVCNQLLALPDIEGSVHLKDDIDLMRALVGSDRFSEMLITNFVSHFDVESQTQFAAVTVQANESLSFILFRGTDATLVGWKENFNMTFICPVPAQESAVDYLETVAASVNGDLILGGHSKGGNLAMFAATYCDSEIKNRIVSINNFDGPGFVKEVILSEQYQHIRDKMSTFVPQSSIVGMLMEHEEQYIIVRSSQKVEYLQHNIFTWELERNHFSCLDSLTDTSQLIDHTIKGWVADLDLSQREKFVDALYSIIANTKAHTIKDMEEKWFDSAVGIFSSIDSMDDETRKLILKTLSVLANNAKKTVGQAIETWVKTKEEESKQYF
jgi:hypothetical protein